MLRTGFSPAVPRIGSLGASGDLVPLAHATQALRGIGFAYVDKTRMSAAEALRHAGLLPLELDGRDALGAGQRHLVDRGDGRARGRRDPAVADHRAGAVRGDG